MHLVQTMAYVNETPWHGLGNQLAHNQPLEVWAHQAGMNWKIEESEVRFVAGNAGLGSIHAFPEQKVLYRSDTRAPLSVVSSRYQVVQPSEILEFYRDLTEVGGFELETAGVLKDGSTSVILPTDDDVTISSLGPQSPIHSICVHLSSYRLVQFIGMPFNHNSNSR